MNKLIKKILIFLLSSYTISCFGMEKCLEAKQSYFSPSNWLTWLQGLVSSRGMSGIEHPFPENMLGLNLFLPCREHLEKVDLIITDTHVLEIKSLVQAILNGQADINSKLYETPIWLFVALFGDSQTLAYFIKHGARFQGKGNIGTDEEVVLRNGSTAYKRGSLSVLRELVEMFNALQRNSTHRNRILKNFKTLVQSGVNTYSSGVLFYMFGKTYIGDRCALAKILLNAGANPNCQYDWHSNKNSFERMLSIFTGEIYRDSTNEEIYRGSTIRAYLACGAHFSRPDEIEYITPSMARVINDFWQDHKLLFLAIENQDLSSLKSVIQRIPLKILNEKGENPLHHAVRCAKDAGNSAESAAQVQQKAQEIVILLLYFMPQLVRQASKEGLTPVFLALTLNKLSILRNFFIRWGYD